MVVFKWGLHDDYIDLLIVFFETIFVLLLLSVPPIISSVADVTQVEGHSATLVCLSEGDPAPSMTFRKVGNAFEFKMGENVRSLNVFVICQQVVAYRRLTKMFEPVRTLRENCTFPL